MGMRGSSTRALFLHEVEVPAKNVLGEVGGGPGDLARIVEPWLQHPMADHRPLYAPVSQALAEAGGYPFP